MDVNEALPSTSTAIPQLSLPNGVDRSTVSEIFLSVHNFLEQNNCVDTARFLREELDRKQLLAPRPDLLEDTTEPETFVHFQRTHNNTVDLLPIVSRLNDLSQRNFPVSTVIPSIRLSAHEPFSLTRNTTKPPHSPPKAPIPTVLPFHLNGLKTRDRIQTVKFGGHVPSHMVLSKKILSNYRRHTRTMGHKAPVYCITFDRTGKYIITGADDNLIKVWNAETCLLRYTYRGHSGEICDLSVSHENTLLASGSNDKTVRIWCMQNGATREVFKHHTGQLSSVVFPAFFQNGIRYLVSTSTDCSIVFYRFQSDTRKFIDHVRFPHKEGGPGKFLCSSYSAGGNFAAFAGSQKTIYIYLLEMQGAKCIATLKDVHSESIDTMAWSHRGLKFITGAHDGRILVWDFKFNNWKAQELKFQTAPVNTVFKVQNKKNAYKVSAVAWTLDDDFIFTTGSDNYIRVWNSKNGTLVATLKGHDKIVYYMRAHPTNADLMISAGYDGICSIWDVPSLSRVKRVANNDDASKNQSIFDAALSPDGTMCAFADDTGYVTFNGIYPNERAKIVPKQQFFDTDFNRCMNDATGFTLDTVARLPPHLCDPPSLERLDSIPHSEEWQVLVPGRAAMLRDATINNLPGDFCAWKKEKIFQPFDNMDELIRTAGFEANYHYKQYQMESQKNPPKGWNPAPLSPEKPIISRTLPFVEPALSPDFGISAVLDSDSDDDDYSADSSRSVTPDSESEEEHNPPDELIFDDENDSDYYEGYAGHDTVFRNVRRRRRQQEEEVLASNQISGNESTSRRSRRRERHSPEIANSGRSNSASRRINGRRHTRANPITNVSRVRNPGRKGRPRRIITSSDDNNSPERSFPNGEQSTSSTAARAVTPGRNRRIRQYPEWMKKVSLQRFPYIPQLGDQVVYFPYAHKIYLNDCKKQKVYNPKRKDYPRSDLNGQEYATVEKLEYRLAPYHCVLLWLGLHCGQTIKVYYHELNNTPDFIIPCQLYENSIPYDFKTGDRIESIMDNKWWTGIVQSRELNQGDYSECQCNSVKIEWDNGDEDNCCPWDIQPLTPGRRSDVIATREEVEFYSLLSVRMEDWNLPSDASDVGRNAELARTHHFDKLNSAIQQLNTVPALSPFQHPVNLAEHPTYMVHVPYPIDLQTISERITNKYYRTLAHLKLDIQLIASNAIKFNEANSEIALNSKRLVQTLFYVIDNANPENASNYFASLFDRPPSELTAFEMDLFLKTLNTNRSQSQRLNESLRDEPTEELWIIECRNAYEEIITDRVKNLLEDDLTPVLECFNNGDYESPNEFLVALTDVIQTCMNNQERRSSANRELNTVHGNLDHKFKPIIEKYNRMANDSRTNRQRRSAAAKVSPIWRNGRRCQSNPRDLRRRSTMNYNGVTPSRRSTRHHVELNYAELNQGRNAFEEDLNIGYRNSQPGPSARRSQSLALSSRPNSQNSSSFPHQSIQSEIELSNLSETFADAIPSHTVASTPSAQENDSDYVGDDDVEEEEENDYEHEAVPEPPLSPESEETAVSTGHSDNASPTTRKRPIKRKKGRESMDTTSTRSSEENIRRSTRKRKPKARETSPEPTSRKKSKTQPRRSSRARSNAQNYYDGESDDEENASLPSATITTKYGRTVQRKRY